MTEYLPFSLTVFIGFFAVMNPIANTTIFLGIVEGKDKSAKKMAFIIVTVFVAFGKYIFRLFGITIPAFKVTGDILIFYIGFEMLMSRIYSSANNFIILL